MSLKTERAAATSGGVRALLSRPAYACYWLTRVLTQMASQMMMVALGWQMYDLTGSAWDLGLVGLVQFLPALLLTLPAGHIADRHHRGRVMMAATALQALAAVLLAAGTHGGWMDRTLILAVSALLGIGKAFQMPASQALPALLVPAPLLAQAVAFGSSGMQVAIIGGPAERPARLRT